MSLSEKFITAIRAQPKSANTAISKDVGIYTHTLHPLHTVDSSYKKSSALPNCVAVSSSHIFAAQAEKAIVHVYSRDRGNQEALVSFPERIHSVTLVNDGLLALGTAEGRIILWEVCTGRQVSTPASHLQTVSCLASTSDHLISGSEDSNIHVWSIPSLLSLTSGSHSEPLRSLSNHRAAITSLAVGHSSSTTNICISGSKDNTCIVWNYQSGELLRTFLLPTTPLCMTLDPCDRAFYVGFDDSSVQLIDLFQLSATTNALYDPELQSTPIQVQASPFGGSPPDLGLVHCLGLSYDGTTLLSGHASGKIIQWQTGPRNFSKEIADLNAPVTNLTMLSPFPSEYPTKAITVSKPRLGEGNHTFVAQFTESLKTNDTSMTDFGFPPGVLEEAILDFSRPSAVVSTTDAQLKKENEELWAIVNEQNALQKQTWSKYRKVQSGKVEG